jgi:hypothetical protein
LSVYSPIDEIDLLCGMGFSLEDILIWHQISSPHTTPVALFAYKARLISIHVQTSHSCNGDGAMTCLQNTTELISYGTSLVQRCFEILKTMGIDSYGLNNFNVYPIHVFYTLFQHLQSCDIVSYFLFQTFGDYSSSSSSSSYGSTAQFGPWPPLMGFRNNNLFTGLDCYSSDQPPTWRTRSPYL